MNILVLGAGLQGCACAYDLLKTPSVGTVTLADLRSAPLPSFLTGTDWGGRLVRLQLDVTDEKAVRAAMAGHVAVLCALPYYFNLPMTKAAIDAGCHFADLGGNTDIVFEQKKLGDAAAAKGVTVIPNCGLAPGMVNILAQEGINRLDQTKRVKIFVGGLPQQPEPPLNYHIVYSLEGVLDYYTTSGWVLRDGRPQQVEALSELEAVEFPAPIGTLEAFNSAGGISTLPFAYEGKIDVMEYKTLRYPGHAAIVRAMRDLGLFDLASVDVKGTTVVPRDAFIATAGPRLTKPQAHDLVALLVEVSGDKGGKPHRVCFRLIDYYDATLGITSMMRTTGYSLSVTGLMQSDGRITPPGVHTPEEAVPFRPYVDELAKRGVVIEEC